LKKSVGDGVMNPPKMVASDTPDRGRMWYLVDANPDFIPEVKQFLDWKAATRHAPATVKAYCSRLVWLYCFLAHHRLQVAEVTPMHFTEFVVWLCHPLRSDGPGEGALTPYPLQPTSVNLIVHAVTALYRFLERRGITHSSVGISLI